MKNVTTLEQLRETLNNALKKAPVTELEIREFHESEEVIARMRDNNVPEREIVKHAVQVFSADGYMFDVSTHRTAKACEANAKKLVKALAILQEEALKEEPSLVEDRSDLGKKGLIAFDVEDVSRRVELIRAVVDAVDAVAPELVIKTNTEGTKGIVFTFWHKTTYAPFDVLDIVQEVAASLGYPTPRARVGNNLAPRPHTAPRNSAYECLIRHGYRVECFGLALGGNRPRVPYRRIISPEGVEVMTHGAWNFVLVDAYCEDHNLMRSEVAE